MSALPPKADITLASRLRPTFRRLLEQAVTCRRSAWIGMIRLRSYIRINRVFIGRPLPGLQAQLTMKDRVLLGPLPARRAFPVIVLALTGATPLE
ncbi:MAG TPA: hypothetical protein VI137_06265, partial [Pseudolabrys sp.]